MRRNAAGFTILEVLVALIVVTVGLLGLLGTLGPITKLAGQGRRLGRAAQALASRVDLIRAEIQAAAPACSAPASGSQQHADGVFESWSALLGSNAVEVRIVAGADTLVTRIPCP